MCSSIIILMKKSVLLFLLISPLLLSLSTSAGRPNKFVNKLDNQQLDATHHQEVSNPWNKKMKEEDIVKERMLRANNRDYGNYDPAPALVRPPFKLIPN